MKSISIRLNLGDTIELIINNKQPNKYYIYYLDNNIIKLYRILNDSIIKNKTYYIVIEKNKIKGFLNDLSNINNINIINSINVVSHNKNLGYAKQNNFIPKTWIKIYFKDLDNNYDLVGKIITLKNDLIEIKLYDKETNKTTNNYIYIDFKYIGLPEYLDKNKEYNLIKIEKIPTPKKQNDKELINLKELENEEDEEDEEDEEYEEENEEYEEDEKDEEENIEYEEENEEDEEDEEENKRVLNKVTSSLENEFMGIEEDEIIKKDEKEDIIFDIDEELNKTEFQYATIILEKDESNKRYTLEQQISDLMEKFYSKIPGNKRTKEIKYDINNKIDQFIFLREDFSHFNKNNGYVTKIIEKPLNFNPIISHIKEKIPKWILKVISEKLIEDKKSLLNKSNIQNETIKKILEFQEKYKNNENIVSGVSCYINYYNEINDIYSVFKLEQETIKEQKNMDISPISTNIDNDIIIKKYENYIITRIINDIKYATFEILKNNKKKIEFKTLMKGDEYHIESFIVLPDEIKKSIIENNILIKSNIGQKPIYLFKIINKIPDEWKSSTFYNYNDLNDFLKNKFNNFNYILNYDNDNINNDLSIYSIVKSLSFYNISMNDISLYNKKKWDKKNEKWIILEKSTYSILLQHLRNKIQINRNSIKQKKQFFKELLDKIEINNIPSSFWNELSLNNNIEDINSYYGINLYENEDDDQNKYIKYTTTEILSHIINYDNSYYLNLLLSNEMFVLNSTEFILNKIEKSIHKDKTEGSMYEDCSLKFLAKKYRSLHELNNDNHEKEIYFDKQFDETPYYILDLYNSERSKMDNNLFLKFLQRILKEKHGFISDSTAAEMALTLFNKKKLVREGHYAILEEDKQKKQKFYKRNKNNIWIPDDTVNNSSFLDNNMLFCNVNSKCIKNSITKNCDNINERLNNIDLQNEYKFRVQKTVEEYKKEITSNIDYIIKKQTLYNIIRKNIKYNFDNIKKNIAHLVDNILQISPYNNLKLKILAIDDEKEKSDYILRFVNKYCREPVHNIEDIHWYYCIETDTKLFPRSLFEKARIYNEENDINIINKKMNELIYLYAEKTSNGYIDKYSGDKIADIEYVEENKYNEEGFIIEKTSISKDLWESIFTNDDNENKNIIDPITGQLKLTYDPIEYDNYINRPEINYIKQIFEPIVKTIGLNENLLIVPIVIRTFRTMNNSYFLMNEIDFNKFKSEKIKTDKSFANINYNIFKSKFIFYFVVSFIFIEVQISLVNLQISKTKPLPDCIKSFDGYPLDDDIKNVKGIEYFSCVVFNLVKEQINISNIWKILTKATQNSIFNTLFETIKKLMLQIDINNLYDKKREFIYSKKINTIPPKYNITNKWQNFLPPIIPFNIQVNPLPFNIKESNIFNIVKNIINTNILVNKISEYTLSIIEHINNIIKKQENKLISSNLFLENSCCQDNGNYNPFGTITYFININSNIFDIIKIVKYLSLLQNNYSIFDKGTTIYFNYKFNNYHKENIYINKSNYRDYNQNIFYLSFIYYANLDNNRPIPLYLQPILGVNKPNNYNSEFDLEQKIDFLKNSGKNCNLDFFKKLIKSVQSYNVIKNLIEKHIDYNDFDNFKEYIIYKKYNNNLNNLFLNSSKYCNNIFQKNIKKTKKTSSPFTKNFMEYLTEIIKQTEKNVVMPLSSNNKIVIEFNNFLRISINDCFKNNILKFIKEYNNKSIDNFNLFFDDFIKPYQNINIFKNNYNENFYNYCFKLKNSIHFITKQIPNIYIYSTFSQFNKTPESWKNTLLNYDIFEISKNINNYFDIFNSSKFNDINTDINDHNLYYKNFLNQINTELFGLYEFLNNFPLLSNIFKEKIEYFFFLDNNTITLLFQYCMLLSIDTYINIVNNTTAILITENDNEIEFINSNNIYENDFKKDVADLLTSFINNFNNINQITNISYNQIKDKVDIMKQKEKKNLATNFLGKLNRNELRIQNDLKKYKLGNWSENIHFFRYNKAHETEARKLLDQYIDYDDYDNQQNNYPLAKSQNIENDENVENDEYVDENEYSYGIEQNFNDDEYDDNEYDNDDNANNDDFDLL